MAQISGRTWAAAVRAQSGILKFSQPPGTITITTNPDVVFVGRKERACRDSAATIRADLDLEENRSHKVCTFCFVVLPRTNARTSVSLTL